MPALTSRQLSSRPANLPVIDHPKIRLGEKNTLNIVGSSASDSASPRSVLHRPSSVSCGQSQVDLLPELRPESCPLPKHHRMLTWPPVHEIKSGQQKSNIPKQTLMSNVPRSRYNAEQLYELVKESLNTGFHGVKQLFKANDPQGSGVISRAGLSRILYHLIGYLTVKQGRQLLERLGLESMKTISFDEFMSIFRESETVQREWMSPCTRKEVYEQRKRSHPEESLRNRTLSNQCDNGDYVLATYANALLKDKCKHSDFNLQDHLAPSCFEKNGIILPPQLQECLASIGVLLDDYEMQKLWQRYDVENTGILNSTWFFDQMGLDTNGRLKTKTAIPTVSSYAIIPDPLLQNKVMKDANEQFRKLKNRSPNNTRNEAISSKQWHPYNDIMSFLFSKVEENFLTMMAACKNLDRTGEGSIRKEDLQMILRQYGIPMSLMELDKLLEKSRAKRSSGGVSYKNFLYMFMSRSEHGIAHRVMSNPDHRFNTGCDSSRGNLSAEDAEAKLVEVLHGCFLRLLAAFRQVDVAGIQIVNKKRFQKTIEAVFNISLTEDHLRNILLQFSIEEDGLVPYPEFLGIFNKKRPKSTPDSAQSRYKRKTSSKHLESPTQHGLLANDEPSQGDNQLSKYPSKKMERRYRSISELEDLTEESLHMNSYTAYEAYQRLDSKATGKMSRTQMYCWLQAIGVHLHPTELQNLWTSMNLSRDGMVEYAEVYNYFVSRQKQQDVIRSKQSIHSESKVENDSTRTKEFEFETIVKKITPKVIKNWSYIKKCLRDLDPQGLTYVPISDFQNMAGDLKFNLTNVELDELCNEFDFNHSGLFYYLEFLQMFLGQTTLQKQPTMKYNKCTHRLTKQENDDNTTVTSVMLKLRKELLRNWKSLRRSFRKADINNDGFLSIVEFKNILTSMRINIDDEDFYHILSEFDENMDGKVSYDEFISRLIE